MTDIIKRADIITAARSYIGTPFVHQGRNRATGLDCIGLIWNVARDVGYDYQMVNNYSSSPNGARVRAGADNALLTPERQGYNKLMPGDVFLVWVSRPGEPQHFGVVGTMSGYLTAIHAFQKVGRVVEHRLVDFWQDRYFKTYLIPGTENPEGIA